MKRVKGTLRKATSEALKKAAREAEARKEIRDLAFKDLAVSRKGKAAFPMGKNVLHKPDEDLFSKTKAGAIGVGASAAASGTALAASGGAGIRMKRKEPSFGPAGNPRPASFLGPGTISRDANGVVELAPFAVGKIRAGNNPRMWAKAHKGNISVTVEHTEYIRDISGTSTFEPASIPINPGNKSLFGWLSELASVFETYRFQKLSFAYDPAVGADTDGKLLLTVDPDVADDLPETKQQMLQANVQLDSTPWTPASIAVPPNVLAQDRLVREGAVPQGMDPHTYDVARLIWATPGAPTTMIGELFVTYRVVFTSPNGPVPRAGTMFAAQTTVAAPIGSVAPDDEDVNGPYEPQWVSGTTFKLPIVGTYRVALYFEGTVFTGPGTLAGAGANTAALALNCFTTTKAMSEWNVYVAEPDTVFTVTAPLTAATLTTMGMRIFAIDFDWA